MSAKRNKRINNRQKKKAFLAAIRGEERKQYFANGGTLAGWRGVSSVQKDKRDKRANRSSRDRKAIREEMDE